MEFKSGCGAFYSMRDSTVEKMAGGLNLHLHRERERSAFSFSKEHLLDIFV